MKINRLIIVAGIIVAGMIWGVNMAQAATVTITSSKDFCVRLWYGTNRNNVVPTWGGQCLHGGQMVLSGTTAWTMPDGWYTWDNITGAPSGYRLVGIDGAGYQQGGGVSWNVRWEPTYTLTVNKSGSGSGTVSGPGISCGGDCSETFNSGNTVQLTHSENSGSTWGGWSGACTGTGCIITMNSNKSVTATFNSAPPPPPSVSVSVSPSTVNQGENVTVTWSVSGSVTGCWGTGNWPAWSGQWVGTSGGSSSTVGGLTENPTTFGVRCEGSGGTGGPDTKSVTVTNRYTLTVNKSGTGSGTVTGGNGINCGSSCSAVFNSGNMVGLDATPSAGSVFIGWSSPCSGTGGCVFPIGSNQTVTATFDRVQPTASITCPSSPIQYNTSANVSWSSTNASNCTVSPCSGSNCTGRSGSISTGNLTSPQAYTVNCTGN